MDKNLNQTLKIILISALVSGNIIVWHEALGFKFLVGIFILSIVVILSSKTRDER
ncbi:MAG: hypothetical protein JSV30_03390 [Candidatus Omnitrophota bacterium]|nr:MAG: hypothetical protein JSV30_03390 [Candidatus Omnitrophota bacterium]